MPNRPLNLGLASDAPAAAGSPEAQLCADGDGGGPAQLLPRSALVLAALESGIKLVHFGSTGREHLADCIE